MRFNASTHKHCGLEAHELFCLTGTAIYTIRTWTR
jgi:hypothetical protein